MIFRWHANNKRNDKCRRVVNGIESNRLRMQEKHIKNRLKRYKILTFSKSKCLGCNRLTCFGSQFSFLFYISVVVHMLFN